MQQTSNFSKIMQLKRYSLLSTSTLLYSLLLLWSVIAVESATSHKPNQKTTLDDFIKKSCQVTLYSDLCYSSLSSSYTGDPDLGKLTYAAIKTSLGKAVRTTDYVEEVSTKSSTGADAAVRDCVELTKEAVSQVRRSLDEMARILRSEARRKNEAEGRKSRFQVSNVQTWMSAAITDQDTCMDGLDDAGGGKDEAVVKNDVSSKVKLAVKFISNALALANSFGDATH